MKKLLLSLGLLLGLTSASFAQCVGAGNINIAVLPGMACNSEPTILTYGATSVGLVPAAAATDVACLIGSASRVTRLQMVRISGSGTAISTPVVLLKRASANTGGTAATGAALPVPYALDSTNSAATATTTAYTANPTIVDSAPGILDNGNLGVVATTVGAAVQPFLAWDYLSHPFSQAPTLRGIAQMLCVNLTATTPTALLNISFRWSEAAQ